MPQRRHDEKKRSQKRHEFTNGEKTRLRLEHRDREHYGNTRHAEKLREGRPQG